MGKSFEKRGPRPDRPLAQRPMAGAFRGMRVGPECLECGGPIDSREAYSLVSGRGSRKTQRHGYLHPDCEATATKRYADRIQANGPGPVTMSLPIYSSEEIEEILRSRGVES